MQNPVLELEVRKKMYDHVCKSPGNHFQEIKRVTGLSTGTAQHHLTYLKRHGLITEEKKDNYSRYYPTSFSIKDKGIMALLRQKTVRYIVLFILEHDNATHTQIRNAVAISPSTLSFHMKKLKEEQVVADTQKGKQTTYALDMDKKEIVKLLITYKESFMDSLVDRIVEMWDI